MSSSSFAQVSNCSSEGRLEEHQPLTRGIDLTYQFNMTDDYGVPLHKSSVEAQSQSEMPSDVQIKGINYRYAQLHGRYMGGSLIQYWSTSNYACRLSLILLVKFRARGEPGSSQIYIYTK